MSLHVMFSGDKLIQTIAVVWWSVLSRGKSGFSTATSFSCCGAFSYIFFVVSSLSLGGGTITKVYLEKSLI